MLMLQSLFRRARSPAPSAPPKVDPTVEPAGQVPPLAPSVDQGIPAVTVAGLLAAHADLLARMKLCYGADKDTFERELLAPISRLASYVNVLPATADNYFCETGGLFRMALEVSFFALQGTDAHIVSGRATISARRQLEPRWRLATFFAGLCGELHRTLSQLIVTDERGNEWPAYLGPLTEWLSARQSPRFFVRWMPKAPETRELGLFTLPHVVTVETMQYLATGNGVVVPQLLASVSGIPVYREQNVLMELVKRATALVIDRNLIANANRYGRPILGAHIERYLIDAMRRLVVSHPGWLPNAERSRVWLGKEGLFIVWPNATTEMRKILEEDELPGIPQSPQTILEILIAAGVAVPVTDQCSVWAIAPPPNKNPMEAIKLAAPEILLPSHGDYKPLVEPLLVPEPAPTAPPRDKPAQKLSANQKSQPQAGTQEAGSVAKSPRGPNVRVTGDGEILDNVQPDPTPTALANDGPAEGPTTVVAESADGAVAEAAATELSFRLAAPMRLAPKVREVLAAAIDSLNGDAKLAIAVTVPTGLFVPLEHFKKAGVEVPVALRSLGELEMVQADKAGKPLTLQHDLGGRELHGIVLKPRFVDGLDPSLFRASD